MAPAVAKQKTKSAELHRAPVVSQQPGQPALSPVQLLQRRQGNQALMRLLAQRQNEPGTQRGADPQLVPPGAGGGAKGGKASTLTMAMFKAAYPGIMGALDYQHAKIWFDIIAGWQANREVDEELRAMDQKARENAWSDPSGGTYRLTEKYKARAAAIEAHRKFVDEGSSRVRLDPAKILKADITAPQPYNVGAEHRFRTWAVQYFSAKPLEAELSTRRELVSQWERTEHSELEGGFHANLLWGGVRQWNTGGYIGWDDLMHIPEFRDKYSADVTNGPHIQAIRTAINELSVHIDEMMEEHQNRSDENAEHGVVRHVSEALGGPSAIELVVLRLRVQANPGDTDAKADLAEKEAEAGSYPKLKGPDSIWLKPQNQLAAARRFLQGGQIELAAGAIAECQKSTAIATARFAGYERRVMKGAGVAVKWLERAKMAGKIASGFTGAGGIVRASITAAGYTFAQEGSQQVVAHWIDPSNKIDLAGLAQQAAIDGLATLFGGLTQGAFVNALSARFGARLVASGLSEAATKTVLSAAGATTASFYNVPAKIVLDKIIAGKAMPRSLSEVCDMVVVEAVHSGAMDVVGGYVHKSGAGHEAKPEAAPTKTGLEVAPPKEVVEALAGPEGAAYTQGVAHAPMIGKAGQAPAKPISAEARRIAARLDPIRVDWGTLSPASRAQRLIDAVHAEMASAGLPKPTAIFYRSGENAVFDRKRWVIRLEGAVITKKELTVDEFADACEEARHEMEHALQDFRIARREARLYGDDATALATRLQIPKYIAETAIKANDGRIQAEKLEGTADLEAAAHYESAHGAGSQHRQATIQRLPEVIRELAEADQRVVRAKNPLQASEALQLQNRAIEEYNKAMQDYVNLPEEIPAREVGRQVNQAVKERIALNRQIAEAKNAIRRAKLEVDRRWRLVDGGDKNDQYAAARQAALSRAVSQLLDRLNEARELERNAISGKGKS
ncbi:hypothetical protein ABIF69_004529 [Bradyrhizobium japonicum]